MRENKLKNSIGIILTSQLVSKILETLKKIMILESIYLVMMKKVKYIYYVAQKVKIVKMI